MERLRSIRSLGRKHPSRRQTVHRVRRVQSRSGARSVEMGGNAQAGVCVECCDSEFQRMSYLIQTLADCSLQDEN